VRGNVIKENVIGVAFMSVRDSGVIGARIGGTGAGDGNEIRTNEVGVAIRNSGNRVNRVLIQGNDIWGNKSVERGAGIALSNSYVEIVDNDIRNNAFTNNDPGKKAGIAVFNSSDALIKYNRILDNSGPAGII
jgi:nitrous oxidase accessory protein NosD